MTYQEEKSNLKKIMIETRDLNVYREAFTKLLNLVVKGDKDGKEDS